jgi:transposase
MYYVGLDVHQKKSSVCILDSLGKKVKEFTVPGGFDRLLEELAKLPRPLAVCFEASTGCGWLCDQVRPLAQRIEVAHPGQVRLIFRSKKKNDRIDAAKLATLLFLGQVPKAYIPDASVRAWRGLMEFRRATVDKRTRAKNALRALLRNGGIQNLHPRKGLWAKKGLTLLRAIELPAVQDRLRRDWLMEELDQYVLQVKRVEKELDWIASPTIMRGWRCCGASRAWGRGRRKRCWHLSTTPAASGATNRWAPTLAWCPARTRVPMSTAWATSRGRARPRSASC